MDGMFSFLGAFIGGVAAGLVNWFLIDKQHRHAKELQDRQFAEAERDDERQLRYDRGSQIAAWDNARTDRRLEWRHQRNREFAIRQREANFELQAATVRLVKLARDIYGERMDLYHNATPEQLAEGEISATESLRTNGLSFNETRDQIKIARVSVEAEELVAISRDIERLAVDMATIPPGRWADPNSHLYDSHEPDWLIVDLRDAFLDKNRQTLEELQKLENADLER